MKPEEAIEIIKIAIAEVEWNYPMDYAAAFEEAVNVLEKQIPKKPIDNIEREWFECPTCGRVIVTYHAGERHHCKCGQTLNWEGTK